MRSLRVAALALVLGLIGSAGQAQTMTGNDTYGIYLRAEGGWNHLNDLSAHGSNGGLAASASTDEGYLLGGAVGMGFGMWRAEINLDWRDNSFGAVHVGFPGTIPKLVSGSGGGDIQATTDMINGYINLPYNWNGLKPYVGAGMGAAILKFNGFSSGGIPISGDASAILAMQAMAGVSYDLTPNWSLGFEYRFLNGFHPGPFRDKSGNTFNTNDYRNHSLLLSVTYSFGAPPQPAPAPMRTAAPAPMAAPAAAPSTGARQLFIVFFDFDKSSITEAGRKVLDAAAVAVKRDQAVRIELTGYTDTMGTVPYNVKLSERRADAVRDYLSKAGIPANRMDVAWKGKTDLRVPTPDQVREPQNRRVEIIIP
jgi:outer membrane protein OmpA-like peptidoglycan-associated protein